MLETLAGLGPPTSPSSAPFALTSFNFPLEMWNHATHTLILFGATNVGKTSLAKALLPRALMTRHIDKLRDYKRLGFKGIILDDMSFNHLKEPELQIHLLDRADETQVHCRYGVAEIPAETPVIITSNKHPTQIVMLHVPAVERRCFCVQMVSVNEFHVYKYDVFAAARAASYQPRERILVE